MEKIRTYVQYILSHNPLLAGYRNRISVVLAGSRSVGYCVSSSDYDLLGLCDSEIYTQIAASAGRAAFGGIDISMNEKSPELGSEARVDMLLCNRDRVEEAFQSYNDVVIWIWMNSRIAVDPENIVQKLKESFRGYPREVLEQKLKRHWLRDYDLSLHGITYHAETGNIFSVIHALTSKMAEFCKLCCLLEGKPFPYDKWLLKACYDTRLGKQLIPIFQRVLGLITTLDNDIKRNWPTVQEAIRSMDTDACDIMEDALVEWGFDRDWVHNAHHDLVYALFDGLI